MVHKCATAVNGCLNKDGVCSKGYQKKVLCPNTTFDEKGMPIYQRLNVEDLTIVPHNRKGLLDWGGHVNWEWSATTHAVLYLYKVSTAFL
jgi:hypothetical protein